MLFRQQHRKARGLWRRAAAVVSAARREFNYVDLVLKLIGVWGLRPQRVLGRALAFLAFFLVAAAPSPPATPTKVEQVRKTVAESLLGQSVTDPKGDLFGHVVDVLIDADGTPHAAVIESSGFFGIGNRETAVDWKALSFAVQQDHIAISVRLDPDKLKLMPEYKPEAPSVPVATEAPPAPAKPH